MYFLCDRKYQRTGQSCTAFGASFVHKLHQLSCCNILQSVHTSPLAACRYVWGGKNSLRSNIMPPVSKHCSAAHCASQRCPSASGGNYLCYENLLECIADFNAYNSNIKETPAVSKSQRKSLLFGGHCVRYVQT